MEIEITKREILVSIIIGALILSIAALFFSVLQDKFFDTKTAYESSLKIDNDKELLDHAIDTKVGNVLVTGVINGVNLVTLKEIKGSFIKITKTIEKYTMHTKIVCDNDGNCHTETYWTWDIIDTQEKQVNEVSFLGRNYGYGLFNHYPEQSLNLSKDNVNTNHKIWWNYIYESSDVRWSYDIIPSSFSTTMFVTTKYGTLSPYSGSFISLYPNKTINETIAMQDTMYIIVSIIYWLVIIAAGGFVIYQYVSMENNYLEK